MEENIQRSNLGWGKVQGPQNCITGMVKRAGNVKPEEKKITEEKIAMFQPVQDRHMDKSWRLFREFSGGVTDLQEGCEKTG